MANYEDEPDFYAEGSKIYSKMYRKLILESKARMQVVTYSNIRDGYPKSIQLHRMPRMRISPSSRGKISIFVEEVMATLQPRWIILFSEI